MLRRAMNVVVASLCRGALQVMLPRSTATQRRGYSDRSASTYLVWLSTAAVSAGRYFAPINQATPERRMIPDTNKNATRIFV